MVVVIDATVVVDRMTVDEADTVVVVCMVAVFDATVVVDEMTVDEADTVVVV